MEFKIEVDITSNKDAIKSEVLRQAKLGLRVVGDTAAGYAREDCPVDTGLLRNSIAYALAGEVPQVPEGGKGYSDDSAGQKGTYSAKMPDATDGLAVYVGSNVEYAAYVEYRDAEHKTGKAHFLRDAIQNNMDEYEKIIATALKAIE